MSTAREDLSSLILTADEEKQYQRFKTIILTGTDEQKTALIPEIEVMPPSMVFKMIEKDPQNPEIKLFFRAKEPTYQKAWAKLLAEQKNLSDDITSVDKKEHVTTFNHYVGAFLFHFFRQNNCQEALDKSCEQGNFHALTKRCDMNFAKLRSKKFNASEEKDFAHQIVLDTARLGNLYWSAGYADAAIRLLFVGNHYGKLATATTDSGGYSVVAKVFFENAIEYFFRAKILSEQACSQYIMTTLYKGKSLGEIFYPTFKLKEWDTIQARLLSYIGNDAKLAGELYSTAKKSTMA